MELGGIVILVHMPLCMYHSAFMAFIRFSEFTMPALVVIFLNFLSQVINFYFNLIGESCKNENGFKVHVFNSFFYSKLSQSGYAGVRRWTKKV